MFQSLRPNNQLYILRKDKPALEIGSVISVSLPTPKYQMQPNTFGRQEMVVDIVAKVNDQEITYQKIPATADIADFGNSNIVISDNRDAMNSEVLSLKKKSEDLINSIDYHKEVVSCCESILSQLNPEFAEKKAQQEEMESLRTKVDKMSRDIESLIQALKQN